METGPSAGLTAIISVPAAAAARPARPIFTVMAAVVFGLTIRMRMRLVLHHSLAGVRPVTPLSRLEHKNDGQRQENDEKGYGTRQCSKRINVRLRHGCRQALQIKRQRIDRADGLAGACEFVPGQGKSKQTNTYDRRQNNRQHNMPKCLPRRCAKIARGLFKPAIESVENRKHDQEAKRQRPGQMSAKARSKKPHRRCPTLSTTFNDEIVK